MDNIRYEKSGDIVLVTINRPQLLNSLNRETLKELGQALDLAAKEEKAGCLILTGEGAKAFVAGADIAEMSQMDEGGARAFSLLGEEVLGKLGRMHMPTIAAVNGYALGGGCELALACDIILAADNAVFSQPEVALGIIPGWGGTQRLARRVGPGRAKKMIFTGEYVKAPEAQAMGLADKMVEKEKLMEEALALAEKISLMPRGALAAAKEAIDHGISAGLEDGLEAERELFGRCFTRDEQKDAMKAFLEKGKKQGN